MKNLNLTLLFLLAIAAMIIVSLAGINPKNKKAQVAGREIVSQSSVCPPFYLYDEDDNIIDPVNNINSDKPYSPKQTCGKCHDYDKKIGRASCRERV